MRFTELKLGLLLLFVGCGCPRVSVGETESDAGVVDAQQPTIFCSYTAQSCSDAWATSVIVSCSGALNEDAGGCEPMPGEGHQYCCPVGAGSSRSITCADIAATDQYQAPACADGWHCCVAPWARTVSRACCNEAGFY